MKNHFLWKNDWQTNIAANKKIKACISPALLRNRCPTPSSLFGQINGYFSEHFGTCIYDGRVVILEVK